MVVQPEIAAKPDDGGSGHGAIVAVRFPNGLIEPAALALSSRQERATTDVAGWEQRAA